jgi:protein associated with RNAse G/E
MSTAMKILEMKRHLNKPDESYLCDLLTQGNGYVVLRYVSEQSGQVGDMRFEAGSVTHAYYRAGAGYVLWKMCGPDGRLKGHLFHVCRDLQVGNDRVEYLDMLLDVWIDPDGRLAVLDRDEVEECAARNVIGEPELTWIARQEQDIRENWRQIISDFDCLLQS